MPIHDWTRVDVGLFHAFHQTWITFLSAALNSGGLPPDYFALAEPSVRGPIPDILTLRLATEDDEANEGSYGLAVATAPLRARVIRRLEERIYVHKADRIAIRHRHGELVAVSEIVSPGNKASTYALRTFVQNASKLIEQQIHQLVIDLFPPSKRDPQGIQKAIWEDFDDEEFDLPADKQLTVVAYDAGPEPVAYVEPVAAGDVLPEMPIFLKPGHYVPAPLESSYRRTWDEFFPARLKRRLEAPPAEGSDR
jgi:hypothetical protein